MSHPNEVQNGVHSELVGAAQPNDHFSAISETVVVVKMQRPTSSCLTQEDLGFGRVEVMHLLSDRDSERTAMFDWSPTSEVQSDMSSHGYAK